MGDSSLFSRGGGDEPKPDTERQSRPAVTPSHPPADGTEGGMVITWAYPSATR